MRRWLVRNRDRLVESTMRETGKTYEDALLNEVFVAADVLRFWEKQAERFLKDERVPARSPMVLGRKFVVRRRPLGVVGVIAPVELPARDRVGRCGAGAHGRQHGGRQAVGRDAAHDEDGGRGLRARGRRCRRTCCSWPPAAATPAPRSWTTWTWSCSRARRRTGRKVAARAAERLIPVSLEMGGKDPMIVCADADLDRAANAAATMGLLNSGQICLSVERIYVEDEVHDRFVEKLVTAVGKLRQRGITSAGEADVGAMTFPPQMDTVERHVADALDKGATALTGGQRGEGPGLYYEPTVLVNVNHDMACMREETFGPTLPVMRVSDVDEAVRLANDSVYGLGSSVFTKDLAKGEAIARRIRAGGTAVNDAVIQCLGYEAPFGGSAESGVGSRNGREGILKYTEPHTIMVTRLGLKRDVNWFPNSKRTTKLLEGALARFYGR